MKPDNCAHLSQEEATELADKLSKAPRGEFLIGQALAIAATALEARDAESNIEEMEMLGETLFKEGFTMERGRLNGPLAPDVTE